MDTKAKTKMLETRESLAASSANFDVNAILRGAQLTIVGGMKPFSMPPPPPLD